MSVIDNADRQLLTDFLAGSFHQDWAEDHASPEEVIEQYRMDVPERESRERIASALRTLAASAPDETLEQQLLDELGCYYSPELLGRSARAWLSEIADLVVGDPTEVRNHLAGAARSREAAAATPPLPEGPASSARGAETMILQVSEPRADEDPAHADTAVETTHPTMERLEQSDSEAGHLHSRLAGTSVAVVAPSAAFKNVETHLRSLAQVRIESGPVVSFRFWDPRVLRVFLPTCTPEQLEQVFGPIEAFIVPDETGQTLLAYRRGSDGALSVERFSAP